MHDHVNVHVDVHVIVDVVGFFVTIGYILPASWVFRIAKKQRNAIVIALAFAILTDRHLVTLMKFNSAA